MFTLIYTKVVDQTLALPKLKELRSNPKDKASARVVEFWVGEVEHCDQVLIGEGCEKVGEAYRSAGTKVYDLFEKEPAKVAVVEDRELSTHAPDAPKLEVQRRGRPARVKVEE